MASIITFFVVMFIVIVFGGGLGYILFFKTRTKHQNWVAKCYQLSEGIKPPLKDKDGKIIFDIQLNDLVPYTKDIIIKENLKSGTKYKLQKLNISTNTITADMVENWGENKEVSVLIIHDQATAMKKGININGKDRAYVLEKGIDVKSTKIIFNPMPRERVDLITNNIVEKTARLQDKNNIWAQITTWIVAGVLMIGVVASTFLIVDGQVKISETNEEMQKYAADQQLKASKNYLQATEINNKNILENQKIEENRLGKQPKVNETGKI